MRSDERRIGLVRITPDEDAYFALQDGHMWWDNAKRRYISCEEFGHCPECQLDPSRKPAAFPGAAYPYGDDWPNPWLRSIEAWNAAAVEERRQRPSAKGLNRQGNALPSAPPAEETTMRMRFRRWLLRPVLNYLKETIMPQFSEISAAVDQLGVDVGNKLTDLNTSLGTQLTAIGTEIQQLIDATAGGTPPTQEELQAVLDKLTATSSAITTSLDTAKAGVDATVASLGADDPAPKA